MKYGNGIALAALVLAACATHSNAWSVAGEEFYPVEYIAEEGAYPKAILGFFRDRVYQSYENRTQSDRYHSESSGSFRITLESGAYVTDFVPIFVPSEERLAVSRPSFSCQASDQDGAFLITCIAAKTTRRYRSLYKPGRGFLWFEGVCYPDVSRTCNYVPLVSSKLLFSPAMISSLQRIPGTQY